MRTLTTALLLAIAGCGSGPPNGPFVDAALLVKAPPPTSQVALRLLLVGDAGNPEYARCALPAGRNAAPLDHCVMQQAAAAGQLVEHSALVLLGDNVYPDGIPDGEGIAQKRVLDQQLLAAQTSGSALLIVPGNHDWASGRPGGLAAIQRARARVLATFQQPAWALGTTAPWWIEKAGCPGPGTWDSPDGRVRIIGIDTQWWLHKDEAERRTCGDLAQVEKDAVAGIERALATAGDRLTIVATHHPMASFGSHRLGSTSPQDIPSPPYQALIASLNRALAAHPPHLFVAGHDHDLQVVI
ncbi:MAG: metallophosphoesterase, partial [Myxococcales bacterium]|nr:metallophosphoesterase [Myxococcales bacterium]